MTSVMRVLSSDVSDESTVQYPVTSVMRVLSSDVSDENIVQCVSGESTIQ